MKPSIGGGLLTLVIVLCGCVAPMTTREAQTIAQERVVKYCGERCGALTLARTQKIKSRWLIDFDSPQQKFMVVVEDDGNSRVTVWNKR